MAFYSDHQWLFMTNSLPGLWRLNLEPPNERAMWPSASMYNLLMKQLF